MTFSRGLSVLLAAGLFSLFGTDSAAQSTEESDPLQAAVLSLISDMDTPAQLYDSGLVYKATGYVTPCGRRLASEITATIADWTRQRTGNFLGGLSLDVVGEGLNRAQRRELAEGGEIAELLSHPDAFVLGGEFWPDADGVDLIFHLDGQRGHFPAEVRLAAPELPAVCRHEAGPSHSLLLEDLPHAEIGLELNSLEGQRPIYRILPPPDEERVVLLLSVRRDAWLYCFSRSPDGSLFKLFPHGFRPSAWVSGGEWLELPTDLSGPEGGVVYWPVTGPPGPHYVKCFASTASLEDSLPQALVAVTDPRSVQDGRGADATYDLSDWSDQALLDAFRTPAAGELAEASLTVTVLDGSS